MLTRTTRKINKIQFRKKQILKLSLFTDDMIIYEENPIESTKMLLEQISYFNKGYLNITKVNIKKYIKDILKKT